MEGRTKGIFYYFNNKKNEITRKSYFKECRISGLTVNQSRSMLLILKSLIYSMIATPNRKYWVKRMKVDLKRYQFHYEDKLPETTIFSKIFNCLINFKNGDVSAIEFIVNCLDIDLQQETWEIKY